MSEQTRPDDDGTARPAALQADRLEAYVLGHYMGALSGVRLFDEARRTWAGTPYEGRFATFHEEIRHDIEELETALARLGFSRRTLAKALGTVAGIASRLNPLSRIRERAGVAAHGELEMLQSLVVAKRSMWLTLLELVPDEPRLDAGQLRRLEAEAADQYDRLLEVARETARDRFRAHG
ncbi:hypothetical protein AUQ48_01480 [Kocuria flava]|uniref:Uncharacterized protein n=1 Tax=Kocuria flava TaxID=446860 RepID=A0A2N4SZ02_9MICC|nr:hypothetical protein [Kocuria flava]PLC11159.1 hypothetical protein AUQ48_01480 [Kocuria flava]